MKIRQELPADYDEVYQLVKISFDSNPETDGTVPDYLNDLRSKDEFIPELSLVTEMDDRLVGQIVLYKPPIVTPQGETLIELLLSPISVHPDYFRRGIARAMVEKALGMAMDMGYRAVFLCGDPEFYSKLGFAATHLHGIHHKNNPTSPYSMVRQLYPGALDGITGTISTV